MDELDKKLTTTVTSEGKTYTFRRPTTKQMIAADVLAAQIREHTPVVALTYAVGLSDRLAALNTYVTDPKGFDFGDLFDEEVTEIYFEVAKWTNSFRKPVPEAK